MTVSAQDKGTIVYIPEGGGACRVDQPSGTGNGREVYLVAPATVGKLLAGIPLTPEVSARQVKWIDLLGTTTPGIALGHKGHETHVVLAFPPRTKVVRQGAVHAATELDEVTFHLPATVWCLVYVDKGDRFLKAFLHASDRQVRSIGDTVPSWVFPFGNAHTPIGSICWGNVTTAHLRVNDPLAADNLFFATGFNDHLVQSSWFEVPETSKTLRGRVPRGAVGVEAPLLYAKANGEPGFQGFEAWAKHLRAFPDVKLEMHEGVRKHPFNQVLGNILAGRE